MGRSGIPYPDPEGIRDGTGIYILVPTRRRVGTRGSISRPDPTRMTLYADNNSGEGNSQEKDGTTSNGKENNGHGGENDS